MTEPRPETPDDGEAVNPVAPAADGGPPGGGAVPAGPSSDEAASPQAGTHESGGATDDDAADAQPAPGAGAAGTDGDTGSATTTTDNNNNNNDDDDDDDGAAAATTTAADIDEEPVVATTAAGAADGGDEGPIRPEVVGRRSGGGGFFARMAAAQATANAARATPATAPSDGGTDGGGVTPVARDRKTGRIVRIGCTVLALIGALGAFSGISLLSDVDRAVCNNARAIIVDEEDADEDEIDDLACAAAIERAGSIEDAPAVATEGQATFQGALLTGTGVLQIAAGMLLQRRPVRRNRTIALVATALAVLIPVLGTISLVLALFVAYAVGFSADSRALFGLGRGFGGARRRPGTPPPEPPPPDGAAA